MLTSLNTAGFFLINTVFDLYLFILSIRLLLAWVRAEHFNPISHFIIKLTQPIIVPLRRIIPNRGNAELATLSFIIFLEIIKFLLLGLFSLEAPDFLTLLLLAINGTIKLILNTFFYAILFQAILSWIQPGYSPLAQILAQISAPLLRPLQRLVPPVAGFDISAIPALIILQLLIILL
jgi:YggT family protein